MELLGFFGIVGVILLVGVTIPIILRFSNRFKINLLLLVLLIYTVSILVAYFMPQLIGLLGASHPANDSKILQLEESIRGVSFSVIDTDKHNAAGLSWWDNSTITFTSKTLEEASLVELLGVSFHELGHIREFHTLWKTFFSCLIYYFIALFYSRFANKPEEKLLIVLLGATCRFLIYLFVARTFEVRADTYAKNTGYGIGLATYLEKAIESSPSDRTVDRHGFSGLRYLHPSLVERIKFLKDE